MITFYLRGPHAALVEVVAVLEGSAFSAAYGLRPPYPVERRRLDQFDPYESSVSVVETTAAYDYVKKILREQSDRVTRKEVAHTVQEL